MFSFAVLHTVLTKIFKIKVRGLEREYKLMIIYVRSQKVLKQNPSLKNRDMKVYILSRCESLDYCDPNNHHFISFPRDVRFAYM